MDTISQVRARPVRFQIICKTWGGRMFRGLLTAALGIATYCAACSAIIDTANAAETTLLFATANPGNANLNVDFMHPWARQISDGLTPKK